MNQDDRLKMIDASNSQRSWIVANRLRAEPMFGLVRIETSIELHRSLDNAVVRVFFGKHEARFPAKNLLSPSATNENTFRIHVLTHLVENGTASLSGNIVWLDGDKLELPSAQFNVENIGLLAGLVRKDLEEYGTPAILGALVDSRMFPAQHGSNARAWFNDRDIIPEVPLSFEPANTPELARMHLIRWGFTILDYVIDRDTIQSFRAEYEDAIVKGNLAYTRGTSQRIQQAHRLPTGRKIWLDERVLGFLREWFRDEPCACQTLLYVHGSTQHAHQDTIHLTPYPAGYMCGVWVALQDVEPDSGELFVLPGSHRTPRVMTRDLNLQKVTDDYSAFSALDERIDEIIEREQYSIMPYRPKAGQILVWHENLIHGGAQRVNPDRERHSIVSHYFPRGCIAYYDARGEGAALERLE
jgi:ectoine hydroxylase-related dioxygenase (phytanoyl-CoA dioxygenase family)